jgi:hypothetical protein
VFDTYQSALPVFQAVDRKRREAGVFRQALDYGADGSLLTVPVAAVSAAMAPRGEKLTTFAATSSTMVTYPLISAGSAKLISLVPGIGKGTAIFLSMFASLYPAAVVDNAVDRSFRKFSRIGRDMRRLEMGGDFRDTESAARLRSQAVQDMSAALTTGRRFLGQEARLLHR